jgi:hypothetical protein
MKTQPWDELHTPVPQSREEKAVPAPLHVCSVLPAQRREPGVQTGTTQRPLEQLLPDAQTVDTKAVPVALQVCAVLPEQRLDPGVQNWGGGAATQRPLEQLLPGEHVTATTRPFTQL